MNREQNIDDILKLLKDSLSQSEGETSHVSEGDGEDMSTEDLQQKLKDQYIFETAEQAKDEEAPKEREYVIDSDFLNSAVSDEQTVNNMEVAEYEPAPVENTPHEIVIEQLSLFGEPERTVIQVQTENYPEEQSAPADNVLVLKKVDFTDSAELEGEDDVEDEMYTAAESTESGRIDIYDTEDETESLDTVYEDDLVEPITVFDLSEEEEQTEKCEDTIEEVPEEITEDDEKITGEITEEISEESVEEVIEEVVEGPIDAIGDELSVVIEESETEEEEMLREETEEAESQEDEATVEQPQEPHETFLASMRKTGIDFTTDDIYNSAMKNNTEAAESFMEDVSDDEIFTQDDLIAEALDRSTINIMMQFCDKEELDRTIGDKNVDEFLKQQDENITEQGCETVDCGKEYMSAEQNGEITERYAQKSRIKLISAIGLAVMALLALVMDILPLIEARLSGVFDYNDYPAVYVLFGLQIVVLAAAIRYKELWRGLKRAFSTSPTYESLVSVALALTAIYDILITVVLAISGDSIPNMYNGMAVLVLAISAFCDWFNAKAEVKFFSVYSSEDKKYTLFKESGAGAIGKKMYGGGLESDKSIYSMRDVDFPSGFLKNINRSIPSSKLVTFAVIPMLIIGALGAVVSVFLEQNAYAACACFAVCAYAILPMSLMFGESFVKFIASCKLSTRGIAYSGEYSANQYSDADVMVFGDLHLFKKCKTEDIGIVIYDTKVGYLTLGCLDALYSKIGGPMSGMKMNLPDVFKFNCVTVRRMARNGIDAVVDGKHSIIVGDHAFMQRYGLSFPQNETNNGRSTLCVALNGKVTAKLSVKYEVEPIFEMLVERLYSEGIICAVQTFDPLINSSVIANARTMGETPISVIHGDTRDFTVENKTRYNADHDGVISCSSRLKLCEAQVWLKRMARIRSTAIKLCSVFTCIGVAAFVLLVGFGVMSYANYIYLMLHMLISTAIVAGVCFSTLPRKNYFTLDACYADLEKQHIKKQAEQRQKRSKKIRKITKQG